MCNPNCCHHLSSPPLPTPPKHLFWKTAGWRESSGGKHLFSQRTRVRFPPPTWQLTTSHDSSSRLSGTLSWRLGTRHMDVVHRHTYKQNTHPRKIHLGRWVPSQVGTCDQTCIQTVSLSWWSVSLPFPELPDPCIWSQLYIWSYVSLAVLFFKSVLNILDPLKILAFRMMSSVSVLRNLLGYKDCIPPELSCGHGYHINTKSLDLWAETSALIWGFSIFISSVFCFSTF